MTYFIGQNRLSAFRVKSNEVDNNQSETVHPSHNIRESMCMITATEVQNEKRYIEA